MQTIHAQLSAIFNHAVNFYSLPYNPVRRAGGMKVSKNKNVVFRVSEEEEKLVDDLLELSRLTKQEYIMRRLLNHKVAVQGHPRVYKALKNQMEKIYEELKR